MKKILSLLTLAFTVCLFLVGCFGNNSDPTTTPTPTTTSGQVITTMDDILNISISKTSDASTDATYDLKPLLSFKNDKTIADFKFYTDKTEVATVTNNGVINRVAYGTATIYIIPKDLDPSNMAVLMIAKTFKISFNQPMETYAGTFKGQLPAVEGKPQVDVTVVINANMTFSITYTAGTTVRSEKEYQITAQTISGTFTLDSIFKFEVTSETTLRKTFSGGQFTRDASENVNGFKLSIPVNEEYGITITVAKQ